MNAHYRAAKSTLPSINLSLKFIDESDTYLCGVQQLHCNVSQPVVRETVFRKWKG
jgi:hypothetical protein